MNEREYIIFAVIEDECCYFAGMRPTGKGPSDCVWTTQRGMAARFPIRKTAEDTALAMRQGEVVSMWGHPEP